MAAPSNVADAASSMAGENTTVSNNSRNGWKLKRVCYVEWIAAEEQLVVAALWSKEALAQTR